MRIQQLLYVKEIARCRSMNKAAVNLYISQPSLSEAVQELEKEFGITIFERSRRGVSLTIDGIEFLQFTEKIIEDMDELRNHYLLKKDINRFYLQVSCQHYAFVVDAFIHFLNHIDRQQYSISLKETETITALEDVYFKKSAFCIIVITEENQRYIQQILDKWNLQFYKLISVIPHIFISKAHPLAHQKEVTPEELQPYPLIMFAQANTSINLTCEELFTLKNHDKIIYSHDRGTTNNIIANTNCFNIGTGYLIPSIIPENITSIPLVGATGHAWLGYVQLKTQKSNDIIDALLKGIKKSLQTHYPGNVHKQQT